MPSFAELRAYLAPGLVQAAALGRQDRAHRCLAFNLVLIPPAPALVCVTKPAVRRMSAEYCKMAVVKDEWMYEQDTEYDRILGQTTGLLAQRGDEHAVALLVDVRSMALVDTDEVIRTESSLIPGLRPETMGRQPERSTAGQRSSTSTNTLSPGSLKRSASGSQRP